MHMEMLSGNEAVARGVYEAEIGRASCRERVCALV